MRKRAQRKTTEEPIKIVEKPKVVKKKIKLKKNWYVAFSLIVIFFMVIFLNSYFNISSGDAINSDGTSLSTTYYLSGPDPYYNMRLVEETVRTGEYPFYADNDPILNYPLGRSGGRAPLLNMMAIGFSRLLSPFMSEPDSLGYSMQFVSALFGALLIFPVYFIGKTMFGRKEGILAALLVALIPIHIGSGHGSAYGLFDHDSFNLFLFFLTFLFLILSIKEKTPYRSIFFAILSGTSLAALNMVWVEAQFLFAVIVLYAIVQMIIDIFNSEMNWKVVQNLIIILFAGYLISLPVRFTKYGFRADLQLLLVIGVAIFGALYLILDKKKIPWIVSLPSIFCVGGFVAVILYFLDELRAAFPFLSSLGRVSEILYGSGIYGNKVDLTIAEAGTANISKTVMSYGPALYWLAWAGLILLFYFYFKQKHRRDYLFVFILFLINIWLAGTAGRFLNDIVPLIALLAAWITWIVIEKLDYKQMIRNIRNAGGGFRGLRKGIRIYHLLGIVFVIFLILMPNSFLALDAAVPGAVTKNGTSNMKIDYFGEDFSGAFGSSSYKEQYWVDAFDWLNDQDLEIDNPIERPAFISWWDYGFYASAVSGHPTVADNFQDGIPPAANFHTSKSEKEGIAVWIIRLLEGNLRDNGGELSNDVIKLLEDHVGINNSVDIVTWVEDPTTSPSYLAPIGEEYDEKLSENVFVGEQWPENAIYHDITNLFNSTLDDEGITWLYHDIQEATGYSIRYYGVEGYDVGIFNIFAFLADKSIILYALREAGGSEFPNPEDDFIRIKYSGYKVNTDGSRGDDQEWTAEELNALDDSELRRIAITNTPTEEKDDYFKTMFYRTYIGNIPEGLENQLSQLPCWGMKHFAAEFISRYPYFGAQRSAVVIAKYYEGAILNGTVDFMGEPLEDHEIFILKDIDLGTAPLPVDHDNQIIENNSYNLIAPAGNISIQIRRNTELGASAFAVKTIKLNSTTDTQLAPITEEDAMRKSDNFRRMINITIEPGLLEGYVYENIDKKEGYNVSIDEPIPDSNITLIEINEFDPESGQPIDYGDVRALTTDENGYYNSTDLRPGIYLAQATLNDFLIHEGYVFIGIGTNYYNISKPQLGNIEGTIYYDENSNNELDSGEELDDVNVELLYPTADLTPINVDKLITDQTGKYSFTDLIPGNYILNLTKLNTTTGFFDYALDEPVTIEENETIMVNVSIELAPVEIIGLARYQNTTISNLSIRFTEDESVANNTAEFVTLDTNENGLYRGDVIPGSYNITVDETTDQGVFTYEGKLQIKMGEGIKSYDISLIKESMAVIGNTQYNNINIGNITIRFSPDTSIDNNTAVSGVTTSGENGFYQVELIKGSYIVTVDQIVNETGQDVLYTFDGTFDVLGPSRYDISLDKE